jgi:uncharacterized membrane protein
MRSMPVRFPLVGILAVSACYGQSPAQSASPTAKNTSQRYLVRDLGPLPGAGFSYAPVISNSGLITGWISPPAGPRHAALWNNGVLVQDIGAQVPGAQTARLNSEAFGLNDSGQVAFQAETLDPDPNGEDFCGFTVLLGSSPSCPYCSGSDTPHTCRPFRLRNGAIEQLPMLVGQNGLKGDNGGVNQMNNRGDIVGLAENTTPDPDCQAPQKFEVKPVVWKDGEIHELAIPSEDREGFASGINDKGQIAGWSGHCTSFDPIGQTYLSPVHALLWDADGTLHNLDVPAGSTAGAINNRGQVAGNSGLNGFIWTQAGGAQPLYPLGTDLLSFTLGINDGGDVVGGSADPSFTVLSAVLWQNGSSAPVSLNDLVVDNPTGLYLQLAEGINSRGEISGFASSSADLADIPHAFLAIPVNAAETGYASPARQTAVKPAVLNENARKLLQQRMRFGRFGARLSMPR